MQPLCSTRNLFEGKSPIISTLSRVSSLLEHQHYLDLQQHHGRPEDCKNARPEREREKRKSNPHSNSHLPPILIHTKPTFQNHEFSKSKYQNMYLFKKRILESTFSISLICCYCCLQKPKVSNLDQKRERERERELSTNNKTQIFFFYLQEHGFHGWTSPTSPITPLPEHRGRHNEICGFYLYKSRDKNLHCLNIRKIERKWVKNQYLSEKKLRFDGGGADSQRRPGHGEIHGSDWWRLATGHDWSRPSAIDVLGMARRWDDEALVTVRPRDGEKLVTARQRDGAAKVVRVERERSRESGLEESTVKLFLKWSVRC